MNTLWGLAVFPLKFFLLLIYQNNLSLYNNKKILRLAFLNHRKPNYLSSSCSSFVTISAKTVSLFPPTNNQPFILPCHPPNSCQQQKKFTTQLTSNFHGKDQPPHHLFDYDGVVKINKNNIVFLRLSEEVWCNQFGTYKTNKRALEPFALLGSHDLNWFLSDLLISLKQMP